MSNNNDSNPSINTNNSLDQKKIENSSSESDTQIGDPTFLTTGEFFQTGNDLVIQKPSGEETVVKGYFSGEPQILGAANGAALTADTISSLLNPINIVAATTGKKLLVAEASLSQTAQQTTGIESVDIENAGIGHIEILEGKVQAR